MLGLDKDTVEPEKMKFGEATAILILAGLKLIISFLLGGLALWGIWNMVLAKTLVFVKPFTSYWAALALWVFIQVFVVIMTLSVNIVKEGESN
jgi:hypothetical protein